MHVDSVKLRSPAALGTAQAMAQADSLAQDLAQAHSLTHRFIRCLAKPLHHQCQMEFHHRQTQDMDHPQRIHHQLDFDWLQLAILCEPPYLVALEVR